MIKLFEEFSKEPEVEIEYYDNGQKNSEIWFLNGEWHREDGPAYQIWDENGQKMYERWYLSDKLYPREKWVNKLKEIDSPYYEEQKMIYDAEKYNL